MKTKIVIIVGVLIVLAGAAILFINKPAERTWNTYQATAFGFTIPYPSDWTAVSSTDGVVFYSPEVEQLMEKSNSGCRSATDTICYTTNIQNGLFSVAFAYGNTDQGIFHFDQSEEIASSTAPDQGLTMQKYARDSAEMYVYELKISQKSGAQFIYLFLSSPKDTAARELLKEMIQKMKFVLSGTVQEKLADGKYGQFVSSTKIVFESEDKKTQFETMADSAGRYLISLPVGRYSITPSHSGYKEKQPVGMVTVLGNMPQVGAILIEK